MTECLKEGETYWCIVRQLVELLCCQRLLGLGIHHDDLALVTSRCNHFVWEMVFHCHIF